MCWEDKFKSRNLQVISQNAANNSIITLPANATRVGLIVSAVVTGTNSCAIQAGVNGGPRIETLMAGHPTAVMTIEQFGQLLMGPIVISTFTVTGNTGIHEIILNEPPP